MECQGLGRARVRTPFRDWAGFATILLIAQFFAVAAPLRGQAPSRRASDPFESLQRNLDVAAGEQLRLVSRPRPPAATTIPRGTDDARPASGASSLNPEVNSTSGRVPSAEQRFQLLGIDAGRIFREEGVPVALLRMAQVESNWKPLALSPKGAFGLWQLMPATARRYGLRVDAMLDDRADMDKATHAAARYLRDLHLRFSDWALALAAYNAGEDAVQRAMERGESNDFGNLSRRKLLPAETRAYVPAILAVLDQFGTESTIVIGPRSNDKVFAPRILYAAATRWDRIEEPHIAGRR
jgi:soluble lytic murein transglycosylase-like protein